MTVEGCTEIKQKVSLESRNGRRGGKREGDGWRRGDLNIDNR